MSNENKMYSVLFPHYGHTVKCSASCEVLCDTCRQRVLDASHELLKNDSWKQGLIAEHAGHSVVVSVYGDLENPADVCLECEDCMQVILSAEDYEG